MQLNLLRVQNFRNLEDVELHFSPGFNYLYGENGAGKTALLEAVALLARGRSFRSGRTDSQIRHGQNVVRIAGTVRGSSGIESDLTWSRQRQPAEVRLSIDGLKAAKRSDVARRLPLQTVLPDAAELVYGPPANRRAFLDWGLFHVEPSYLHASANYRQALQQRNAWLKLQMGADLKITDDPWLDVLVSHGVKLGEMRSGYVMGLKTFFQRNLSSLAPSQNVELGYDFGGWDSIENAAKKLGESLSRDVKFGTTHYGPHRADLKMMSGGRPAAELLSRGQAKVTASALILAQAEYQLERTGNRCVILIDDFGAELDAAHWRLFAQRLQELACQVIVTSTEPPGMTGGLVGELGKCELFHVKQGSIEAV